MIIKYKNNYYLITSDESVRIGQYTNGYTWSFYNDEEVINNVLLCGKRIQ
jgi:hypothetical protein